jgi:sugar lactone lactonase YvrE
MIVDAGQRSDDGRGVRTAMHKLGLIALILSACGGSPKPASEPVAPPAEPPAATPEPEPAPAPAPAEPAPPAAPAPTAAAMTAKDVGLATPESAVYDPVDDVYLISNINGGPSDKDGNGFITRMSPDGSVVALKWIDGSKPATPLHAPKGLALAKDVLYVTDIDTVRMFDRATGKSKGSIALKGVTFANDIVVGPDGAIYVSDTGIKIDASGINDAKTDSIWVIRGKKVTQLTKGAELGKPNGVVVTSEGAWVCSFGTGELYLIDGKGARSRVQKLPAGQLDGIIVDGDTLWITSWAGEGVYRGSAGGEFTRVITGIKAPADPGFDTKRKRVIVPLFQDNAVVAYAL